MRNVNDEIVYKKPTVLNVHKNEKSFLADVIPLETPMSVCISVSEYCNLKCEFCIFGCKMREDDFELFKKSQTLMSLELFKKIIDSFKRFGKKIKVVKFLGTGESLIHKDFSKMVRYLKESETAERLHLITNGVLLTPELILELVDAGLDEVQISINGLNDDDYRVITGVDVDFNALVNNIKFFYENRKQCKIFCKIVNIALRDREEEFKNIFECISDLAVIEYIYPMYKSVTYETNDGSLNLLGEKVEIPARVCSIPFYQVAINPDGSVTLCISDVLKELTFGNVNDEDLYDVWNGRNLNAFRKLNLEGRIEEKNVCVNCYLKQCAPTIYRGNWLDDDAERLLNTYYKDF